MNRAATGDNHAHDSAASAGGIRPLASGRVGPAGSARASQRLRRWRPHRAFHSPVFGAPDPGPPPLAAERGTEVRLPVQRLPGPGAPRRAPVLRGQLRHAVALGLQLVSQWLPDHGHQREGRGAAGRQGDAPDRDGRAGGLPGDLVTPRRRGLVAHPPAARPEPRPVPAQVAAARGGHAQERDGQVPLLPQLLHRRPAAPGRAPREDPAHRSAGAHHP